MLNAPKAMPRTKPGDYERALQVATTFGSPKAVKDGLASLAAAQAEHDAAHEKATAAQAEADKRRSAAERAEAQAITARQELADETAEAGARLAAQRKDAEATEFRLTTLSNSLDKRSKDIERREGLLRAAGVRFEGDK